MKKAIVLILMLLIAAAAYAEGIDAVIPNASQWGLSKDQFWEQNPSDYTSCTIGSHQGLLKPDVDVESYNMNCYYVFGEQMNDSKGHYYFGLSKVAYILNESAMTMDSYPACCEALISALKQKIGTPDSESRAVTTWTARDYKIDIGTAKVGKYTGSDDINVIIVITGLNIPKPTLEPTATPRPTPTPKPKPKATPKPTAAPKPQYQDIDFKGVSRHPEKYAGKYVKFTGIVVQVTETSFVEYEGGSLFDEYYVLRVASKYEKYKTIDGYDKDDIVYVVIPKDRVEGGRILEDDKISVYGRYDGIETYTTIFGASNSIPRIEATRIVIK